MNLFNQKQLIINRNKAAANFKNFNFLKLELSNILLEHLDYAKGEFPLTLDLGSHTGEVANILTKHPKVKEVVSLDFAKNMLIFDTTSNMKVLAHLTNLPFLDNTFNLVCSVFSLHSYNNFSEILKEVIRVLKKDGLFLLSIPCFGNLSTLNNVLLESELATTNQFSNRIHPFLDIKTIGNFASNAGFVSIITNKEEITIMYKSLHNLLKDFRGMGENNILLNKSTNLLSMKFWHKFTEIMEKHKNPENNHYPVKIEVCNLIAWKG